MSELDATKQRGWSYAAGWSNECRAYMARAWKEREQPLRLPSGVMLYLHSVSEQAADLEAAALACAGRCRRRDENPTEQLSEYEATYTRNVSAWRPKR